MQRRHTSDRAKRRRLDGQVRKPPRTNSIWPSRAWSAGRLHARGVLADTSHLDTTGYRHRIACYERPRAHEIAAPEPPRRLFAGARGGTVALRDGSSVGGVVGGLHPAAGGK
jgi:hypothetical protein